MLELIEKFPPYYDLLPIRVPCHHLLLFSLSLSRENIASLTALACTCSKSSC